ncbi:MAG: hypothetical protein ACREHD_25810 [Pirellulales bacterium]
MRPSHLSLWLLLASVAVTALADEPPPAKPAADYVREAYREDAEKLELARADGEKLKLAHDPVMRWSNDDDWSGDVFVWTHEGRPEVIGCILSGPFDDLRYIYHEFHLLADKPIAPATVQDGRRWAPAEGLKRERLSDAPLPATGSAARLVQMRKIARSFTAYMQADGRWELRLLPQPLMRYGDEQGEVVDGALFCYVWTKGTDPEVILLLECRRERDELSWHYAPVLFTNREVWLKQDDHEVWHAEAHREPAGKLSTNIYTTAFARSIRNQASKTEKPEAK